MVDNWEILCPLLMTLSDLRRSFELLQASSKYSDIVLMTCDMIEMLYNPIAAFSKLIYN